MTPQRWREIQQVLDAALDLAPESRAAYVTDACGRDIDLHGEVERLLNACARAERTESVLATPAAGFAEPMLADLRILDGERRIALPDAVGTALAGRYTIERPLGQGGMAVVFLARDLRHDRAVAVKVLARDLVAPSGVERFLQEIRVTAQLSHPHVLPVHDSGEVDGLLYFVTPYVEGETLRAQLKHDGAISLVDAIRLLREVADALAFAHARGVVHRDLKPENILLSGGHAVVADFGIAKALADAAETGTLPNDVTDSRHIVLGTPAYMAPEQADGNSRTDHRADLYAFGVIAYELLAGVHPFGARSRQALLLAHLQEAPAPLGEIRRDLPPTLLTLVMGCLAKVTGERPASAEVVLAALDAALHELDVPGDATRRVLRLPRVRASKRAVITTTVLAIIALLWAAGLLNRGPPAAVPPPLRLAVLPFHQSVRNEETHYLAVGLGDALSTELSRLRTVIVPTYNSTRQYQGAASSLSQIAQEMLADAVVSGSVQRVDDRIRVQAQLFDARTSKRIWARQYERPISEVLDIQSAVLEAIVTALELDLTDAEQAQLVHLPTTDHRAYELYLRGREVELRTAGSRMPAEDIREAQSLYTRARDLDPKFALARSRLAVTHVYSGMEYDPTPARFEQARFEAEAALRIQPGLAEAHEALGAYWDVGRKDYAKSIEQIELTLAGRPNSADQYLNLSASHRKQGSWDEAVAALETARQLEPRSLHIARTATQTYTLLRRYNDAVKAWDLVIALSPDEPGYKVARAFVFLIWQGTADSIAASLRTMPASWDPGGFRTLAGYLVARTHGRNRDALDVLNASRHEIISSPRAYRPLALLRAQVYEALGDRPNARRNYEVVRALLTDSIAAHAEDHLDAASSPVANMRTALGLAYAGLGRKQEANREARRAMQLVPLSTHALAATAVMAGAAEVFVQTGETNAALELLELLLGMPAGHEVSVSLLRGNPAYHSLRGNPQFEKLLERFSVD
ncbi:MAG TPA: protein kinase [Longimicrobiales bacterium]